MLHPTNSIVTARSRFCGVAFVHNCACGDSEIETTGASACGCFADQPNLDLLGTSTALMLKTSDHCYASSGAVIVLSCPHLSLHTTACDMRP